MSQWNERPELDQGLVRTLVDAVGKDAFVGMREQFVTDLRSLTQAYHDAIASADFAEARASAHALKGAAANIGLAQLSALAASLEQEALDPGPELKAVLDRAIARLEAVS